jgi:NAD-dependent SIR2 family protein deacetylase
MITDFKKRLFCQMAGLKLQEVDANDPIWESRINLFFSTKAILPPANDPTEYAAAFEAVYPAPEARRNYIELAIKKGTPSFAHRALAALITSKKIPCIFTTNFDQLIETAVTHTDQLVSPEDRAYLTVAAIDNANRAQLSIRESRWPLLAKIHGDFQSVELKNTSDELKNQDKTMRSALTAACTTFGLVVVGYSGRDDSVMEALTAALSLPNAFPSGIYWVARSTKTLLPAVTKFLEKAMQAGISTKIVESQTFDELAAEIIDRTELDVQLQKYAIQLQPELTLRSAPLPQQEKRKFPVLQCSAVPILSMPKQSRKITVNEPLTTLKARELIKEAKVWAIVACNGKEIAAFGKDEDLLKAFAPLGAKLEGNIELNPNTESWARGLLYDAIIRAICRHQPLSAHLKRSGHSIVVSKVHNNVSREHLASRNQKLQKLNSAYSNSLMGEVPNLGFPFREGIQLKLEYAADRWWCVFEPTTFVDVPFVDGSEQLQDEEVIDQNPASLAPKTLLLDWRRERWATRYNPRWASIISAWADIISGNSEGIIKAIDLNGQTGMDGIFQVSPITAWSRPGHDHDYFQRSRK